MIRPRLVVVALVAAIAGLAAWRAATRWLATEPPDPVAARPHGRRPIASDARAAAVVASTASVALPRHAEAPLTLVVEKSTATLRVMADGRELKAFPVAFGPEPVGAKSREGDGRTPEGRYLLIPHHESPGFGECFFVCYPNEADAARGLSEGAITSARARATVAALARGSRPPQDTALGGLILLHGTRDRSRTGLTTSNWTNGCIAMENADLVELLSAFDPGDRPVIDLRP